MGILGEVCKRHKNEKNRNHNISTFAESRLCQSEREWISFDGSDGSDFSYFHDSPHFGRDIFTSIFFAFSSMESKIKSFADFPSLMYDFMVVLIC